MHCLGCYKEITESYCPACRKQLFDKAKVPPVLSFDAPRPTNIARYQEHSKRLSISGVQLKYSLRLDNNQLVLTEKSGQYILKPIPPAKQLLHVNDAPENEHLTMQLAAQVFNIQTAANALIQFKDLRPAYITRRFDVKPGGGKYLQEDFAQLTNRTQYTHGETFKYDGTYEEIGLLIKRFVAAAMPALEDFFRLVAFNYALSNGDAHLKNFSLIRTDADEYRFSPAYDLMSTVLHTPQETDTALDLYTGDIHSQHYTKYGYYGRENFMEFAGRLGLIEKRAARIIDQFPLKQQQVIEIVQRSGLSPKAKDLYRASFIDKVKRLQ
ncbi:HipA domain-containing protein [soil metagenome]